MKQNMYEKDRLLKHNDEQMEYNLNKFEEKFKQKSDKLCETKKKLKDLTKRRNLEIEGFQTELRTLRRDVKKIKG